MLWTSRKIRNRSAVPSIASGTSSVLAPSAFAPPSPTQPFRLLRETCPWCRDKCPNSRSVPRDFGIEADVGAALGSEVRNDHAGVPAAGGHVVDHRHSRFDPEQGERLARVAKLVPRPVAVADLGGEYAVSSAGLAGTACWARAGLASTPATAIAASAARPKNILIEPLPTESAVSYRWLCTLCTFRTDDKRRLRSYLSMRTKETWRWRKTWRFSRAGASGAPRRCSSRWPGSKRVESGYIGGRSQPQLQAGLRRRHRPCRSDPGEFRSRRDLLWRPARRELRDPRPDHPQPPGQRCRHAVPLGDLPALGRAAGGSEGRDRTRQCRL